MPTNQTGDFLLNGKPYLLARVPNARSWQRSGQPDTPSRRSQQDTQYGQLPSEIEHVEVWDDWSGGFGDAYRRPDRLNAYHWGEGMDTRFSKQAIHCQGLRTTIARSAVEGAAQTFSVNTYLNGFVDLPGLGAEAARGGVGYVVGLQRGDLVAYPPILTNAFDVQAYPDAASYLKSAVVFGSYGYLPVLEATQFARWDLGVGGLVTTDTHTMPGRAFAVAGNRLWRVHGPAQKRIYLQSCAVNTDPTVTANWSATLMVADGLIDVSDMIALGDQLFLGLPDGLYAGDQSGTFYNVLAELRNQRHADNARDLTIHDNAVIVPHIGGVLKYQPKSLEARATEIGPPMTSNRSPVRGHVRAVRGYGPWLLAGLWTGSQSYLLAGLNASPGLPYVWHVQQRLPTVSKISRLHVDGITVSSGGVRLLPNRVWAATDSSIEITGTAQSYFFEIPRAHGNPLDPDIVFTPNYSGSARLDMGSTDFGAPGTPKVYRAVEIWADNLLSGNRYADVYYEIDRLPRTLLGRAQTSPKSTLYFSANANASLFTGQAVALSLESFTGSRSETPVYRAVVLRGALRPRSAELITAQVRVADDLRDRRQTPMRPGSVLLQELRALAKQATPVQLIDLAGATSWVNVLAPVEEQEVWQEGEQNPELMATVKMAVLEFSTN